MPIRSVPRLLLVVCAALIAALGLVHAGRGAARAQQAAEPDAPPAVTGARAPEVAFVHIRENLPNPEVQALAQDADGMLWVGTADGLARYDGLRMTPVALADAAGRGLASRRVQRILAARSGAVWVGTDRGLARIDRRTDRLRVWPGTESGACTRDIVGLAEDGAAHLLVGSSSGGLCRVDPQTGQMARLALPWGRPAVALLRGMPSGEVWAVGPAGPDGLPQTCRIAADGGPCRTLDTGGFEPQALGLDGQGRLLALGVDRRQSGGEAEIRRWGRGRFLPLHSGLPAFGRSPGSRLVVVGREAWVATSTDGVLAVDLETGAARTLTPDPAVPTSLPAHRVRALLGDRQGGVWVGTARGLARWHPPPRPFTRYRRTAARPGEISDDRVNGMTETRDGALWVTTNDGLNRLDLETDRFETFRVEDPETEADRFRDAWWQVLEGQDGTLWVGAKRNGLNRLDRRTGRFRRDAEAARALGLVGTGRTPPGFGVRHLFEDRRGRLWLGTSGEGLAVRDMDTGLWRGLRPDPAAPERSLPHPSVNRFFEDAGGQLWVGTDAGIARLADADDGTLAATPVDLGRDDEPVWSFAESPRTPGVLWVGSVGGGLIRYDIARDSVARITEADGLPSDLVYGLLTDDRGLLWASTSRGLARLHVQAAGGPPRIDTYDEADGLPVEGFDLMAFYRSPTAGTLWFGGPGGLVRVDPASPAVAGFPARTVLTSVQVHDRERPGRPVSGDTLTLAPGDDVLTLTFAALDYTAPRRARYRFRLVGEDDGWRTTTGERPVAMYSSLAPGRYRFEVVGTNAQGQPSPAPAVLTVVVRPAWWQTAWFRMLLALGIGLGLVGVLLGTVRRAVRLQRVDRDRIARRLHEGPILGLDLVGRDLDGLDAAAGVRTRVGEVESGLHDVLTDLSPAVTAPSALVAELEAVVTAAQRTARTASVDTAWEGVQGTVPFRLRFGIVQAVRDALGVGLAEARHADLVLTGDGQRLDLTLCLEGVEQAPAVAAATAHAAARVRAAGATLDVSDGNGETRLQIVAPLSSPTPDPRRRRRAPAE